jgi:ATP-binding cassette subfamily F protein 3
MIRTRLLQNINSQTLSRSLNLFSTVPSSSPAIGDTILSFKNVSFEYRERLPIVDKVNFSVKEGSKITIMGQNGSGKSTLMKLMNGLLNPTEGSINIKKGFALSRGLQVVPLEDREKTVRDFFSARLHGVTGGLDGRIASVLKQVHLEGISYDRLMKTFSGGQQARLLLASSLILDPDILLLDEPTNNLDTAGIELLSSVIKNTSKTCIVISHDEHFLNSFTDSVLYLDNYLHKIECFDGNYNDVKREITNKIEKQNSHNSKLKKEIANKKEKVANFSGKGGSAVKTAKKMKESIEELENTKIVVRKEDKSLHPFVIPVQKSLVVGAAAARSLTSSSNQQQQAMTIHSIMLPMKSTTEPALDFSLSPLKLPKGAHVRIRGPNGIGKTTLLESIVENRAKGIEVNPFLEIGYYRQDFHNLNHEDTVLECLKDASVSKHPEQIIRKMAAQFHLRSELLAQEISTLSEGQKGLLSMLCLVLQEPGLLILDEPTNHINFRHLPVIAKAINDYEGTLLIVSHDQSFMDKIRIDLEIDLSKKSKTGVSKGANAFNPLIMGSSSGAGSSSGLGMGKRL